MPDAPDPPDATALTGEALLQAFLPFANEALQRSGEFAAGLASALHSDPAPLAAFLEQAYARQLELWQSLWDTAPDAGPPEADARYRDEAWRALPWFRFLRRQHALWEEWARALPDLAGLGSEERRRYAFVLGQWADAVSPANALPTNPAALRRALASQGESVARGMANLAADLRDGRISMSEPGAFVLGQDLAATPGTVIHESPIAQVIEYAPSTERVRSRPLLIIPPFINKYYILDLQPRNSFVRYAVARGHRVFLVSWRNAGAELRDAGWDDYVRAGVHEPLQVALEVSGARQASLLGFCVGGTLAATAAAADAAAGRHRIASLTLLATLLDFREPGAISAYLGPDLVDRYEQEFADGGVMPGSRLAAAFASLRARELIWHFVEHNYLLGETPPPFDLLHWNGDGTNLPGRLFREYLRAMYLENRFASGEGLRVGAHAVRPRDIDVPAYVVAAREDHIVPWTAAHAATRLLPRAERFVLADSGHIAGIVNPPEPLRRGYRAGPPIPAEAAAWRDSTQHMQGSWWQDWAQWSGRHAGRWRSAPTSPGSARHRVIEAAPGRYVREPMPAAADEPRDGDGPHTVGNTQ